LPRSNRRLEGAVALFVVVVLVVVGGVALNVFLNIAPPVHTDPAAVPASMGTASAERYAGAVEKTRSLSRALLVQENLPGLSLAVAVDGKIVWAEGFGYASVERRAPVTPSTRFRAGSVSKTLTAAAVALLYDRGRIDLDAPVQTYVPAYPQKQWTVTTRQLLGDIAGVHRLRGENNNNDNVPRGNCTSLAQALQIFSVEPLAFEPGTRYRYSTYGWILLSAVVESAAAKSFATFMADEIFQPLGMNRTALEGTPSDADTVSFYGTKRSFGVDQGVTDAAEENYSCFFGAGGFFSTPSDLVRLGSAMLKPGLLKPETIALFQTPLQLKSGASTGFALGWKVDDIQLAGRPVRVLRHRARLFGGTTSLSIFPELGLVVAAMSNENDDTVDPFALQVAETFK
jgi:serine beta-lactamase-like protein LACTB, mitochondrial